MWSKLWFLLCKKNFKINCQKRIFKVKEKLSLHLKDLKINNFDNTKWKKRLRSILKQTKFFNFYKKTTVYLKGSKDNANLIMKIVTPIVLINMDIL